MFVIEAPLLDAMCLLCALKDPNRSLGDFNVVVKVSMSIAFVCLQEAHVKENDTITNNNYIVDGTYADNDIHEICGSKSLIRDNAYIAVLISIIICG